MAAFIKWIAVRGHSSTLGITQLALLGSLGACGRAPILRSAPSEASAVVDRIAAAAEPLEDHDSLTFAPILRAVAGSRVVLLGEQWHGDGGEIALRARLVQALHERLGFNVLVFEADFYSLNHGWPAAATASRVEAFAADNVYPFWSRSDAALPLWRYVAGTQQTPHPLRIAGVDPKHVGSDAAQTLVQELRTRVANAPDITATEREQFLDQVTGILKEASRPDTATQRQTFATLDKCERWFSAQSADQFWIQELRNLRGAFRFSWQRASRDRLMGDNFAWLATRLFPNEKIIVWAHNNHIMMNKWMYYAAPDSAIQREFRGVPRSFYAGGTYLGAEVRGVFGDDAFAIGTLAYDGQYSADIERSLGPAATWRSNFDSLSTLAPTSPGSLEARLARRGSAMFARLRPFRGDTGAVASRVLDYSNFGPFTMRLWEGYDGILFIRRTHGLNQK